MRTRDGDDRLVQPTLQPNLHFINPTDFAAMSFDDLGQAIVSFSPQFIKESRFPRQGLMSLGQFGHAPLANRLSPSAAGWAQDEACQTSHFDFQCREVIPDPFLTGLWRIIAK